jgi:hypothetical protein
MEWGNYVSNNNLDYTGQTWGHFGNYPPGGYYQQFVPYNTTIGEYQSNIT